MEVKPPEEAQFLLCSSLTTFVSCSAAAYYGLYDFLATSTSVLICSVNYWRRPIYGWRRNLDITNTILCALYHSWRATETMNVYYFVFAANGIGSYLIAQRLDHCGIFRIPALWAHSGMHVFGNVANLFLFQDLYKSGTETLEACEIAMVMLLALALVDVLFIGGWPPRWWPPAKALPVD